ncbi:MAG: DNA replication complex GINS family protein, partial [Candidatus Bathyarchaeota archaeon]|nr:DNA replication complex GINS family protein [Candidatus Bathyarchaeota archaeon]
MYNELYEIWKNELENVELGKLPRDFYLKITEYMRKLGEESRMLDKKTAKAKLLDKEMQNVKRMVREVVRARYRKLVNKIAKGDKISSDFLTAEEEKFLNGILPFAE